MLPPGIFHSLDQPRHRMAAIPPSASANELPVVEMEEAAPVCLGLPFPVCVPWKPAPVVLPPVVVVLVRVLVMLVLCAVMVALCMVWLRIMVVLYPADAVDVMVALLVEDMPYQYACRRAEYILDRTYAWLADAADAE